MLSGPSEAIERLSEVFGAVLELPSDSLPVVTKDTEVRLPGWFLKKFSIPLTAEEKREWLDRWRLASSAEKASMEKLQGWEVSEWLYWFSSENEFWRILRFSCDPQSGSMEIYLTHADEPFPVSAVEWAASQVGAEVQRIERIT